MPDRKPLAKSQTERIVRLETEMSGICEDINKIMTNHLPHLEDKIDKLADKLEANMIQSRENTVRIAFVVPIIMTVIQVALGFLLKS